MTTNLSPLQVSLVLHCYSRADHIEHENAPAVQEELRRFVDMDILSPCSTPPNYRLTEKGKAFVKLLLSTPFPEVVYRNPVTKEIIQ